MEIKKITDTSLLIISMMILPFLFNSCSSSIDVVNTYNNRAIQVGGDQSDWQGLLTFYDDAKLSIGFTNDNENLYLCLVTADPGIKNRIMMTGLIIWLKPEEDGKTIGIKFPVRDEFDKPFEMHLVQEKDKNFDRDVIQKRFKSFLESHKKFSVINKDNYPLYLLEPDSKNIELKAGINKFNFVYELKIPLASNKNAQYYVESFPRQKLNITIKTEDMKRPDFRKGGMQSGMSGGMPGGGTPGMGRGRPGGFGMNKLPDTEIDISFDVKLADKS